VRFFIFVLAVVGFLGLVRFLRSRSSRPDGGPPGSRSGRADGPAAALPGGDAPGVDAKVAELRDRAMSMQPAYEATSHPLALAEQTWFLETVAFLCRPQWSPRELLAYAVGDDPLLSLLTLEALGRRDDAAEVRGAVLDGINLPTPWQRFFALRTLDRRTAPGASLVGDVALRLDPTWSDPYTGRLLGQFVAARRAGGEVPSFGEALDGLDNARLEQLEGLLRALPDDAARELREDLRSWRGRRLDREFLDGLGSVWTGDPLEANEGPVVAHEALERDVETVVSALVRTPPRSVVLVGEHGVGKTAVVRAVAARLAERGWTVFEAGHAELVAGMPYLGQLEARMRELVDRLRGRRVLWYVPGAHALAMAGRHRFGPLSALDFLLPLVERGEVVLLGESRPGAWERVVQSKPRVATAFDVVRVEPLDEPAAEALVDRWAGAAGGGSGVATGPARRAALELATQFLGDRALPGSVLEMLRLSRERIRAAGGGRPIETDDLIRTLAMLTGLPPSILDGREGLDLAGLRDLFERRVLGQGEAIDALVDRVAMIKAGTTDPTRPLGVFLFAGPTGTGKTEIAKTLAEFLFGSPDRMIRLDMSEFQTPETLAKIVGAEGEAGEALVDRIRKQPFAVVLLDEFEKANPRVWDLFLQVFDDGRLSDHQGVAVDFRQAIIILTSNLGAVIPSGTALGFSDETGRFHATTVLREVERSFRKEFLNRIDRVVVFRPLTRDTMRDILAKELAEAFRRRGLRHRAWAVEWDEGAIEFLLERGFTADLGARPLKRAVERWVLAPLSTTIVEHRVPEGDQFLLLRADGDRLAVDFIDPDAPAGESVEAEDEGERPASADAPAAVASIGLRATGRPDEIERLRAEHGRLERVVTDEAWHAAKRRALERMGEAGFWKSDARFDVLGRIEYLDRIEAGIAAAGSLLDRLDGPGRRSRDRFPVDVVGRTAARLVLLDAASRGALAGEPADAFLEVQPWSDGGAPPGVATAFAGEIRDMYLAWARARAMQVEVLDEPSRAGRGRAFVAGVSGFAAWRMLAGETGIHVLELPEGTGHAFRRAAARVRVVPQPGVPAGPTGALAQARETLSGATAADENLAMVRHYRREPSPLVRDAAHGWRTGHLDRVLAGDFDLRTVEAAARR